MHTKEDILINTLESMAADAEDAGKESVIVNLSYDDIKTINAALNVAIVKEKESACAKPYNEFNDTIPLMLSGDYKERFIAECRQTKIRYERLKAFCNRIEAAMRATKSVEMPKHDCPLELLREQQQHMGMYLHTLEVRAVIEGIEL